MSDGFENDRWPNTLYPGDLITDEERNCIMNMKEHGCCGVKNSDIEWLLLMVMRLSGMAKVENE
jgi:hypothetical protein